jgi:site-specific recombinase XerD
MTDFLREWLDKQRRISPHTMDTYSHALRLLVEFAAKRHRLRPSQLMLEYLDVKLIMDFLKHIQEYRGNGPSTRNARLAAIKAFMRHVERRLPSALEQVRQVLCIPQQRKDTPLPSYLTPDEVNALLNAACKDRRSGLRDGAMLLLMIMGGMRVSELVGLRLSDLTFRDTRLDLRIRGKGSRERVMTLWKEVARAVRAWMAVRPNALAPELFLNARGEPLSRDGLAHILGKHVQAAAKACPTLAKKKVSPHTLRHTCAINTLRATRDIRKVALWLGHASTQSTEIYLRADPTERLEVLESIVPTGLKRGTFSPPDKSIEMLKGR